MTNECVEDFCSAVRVERGRQHAKWGVQRHDHPVWLAVLTEEVGEVANALLNWRASLHPGDRLALMEELVQVAAVCSAWLDHLDEGGAVPIDEADSPLRRNP